MLLRAIQDKLSTVNCNLNLSALHELMGNKTQTPANGRPKCSGHTLAVANADHFQHPDNLDNIFNLVSDCFRSMAPLKGPLASFHRLHRRIDALEHALRESVVLGSNCIGIDNGSICIHKARFSTCSTL